MSKPMERAELSRNSTFLYAFYLLISTLVYGNSVKGYPSMMVTLLFLGGVQLMALGVIGEYLGRIYEESKQRPVYLGRQAWRREQAPENLSAAVDHEC